MSHLHITRLVRRRMLILIYRNWSQIFNDGMRNIKQFLVKDYFNINEMEADKYHL